MQPLASFPSVAHFEGMLFCSHLGTDISEVGPEVGQQLQRRLEARGYSGFRVLEAKPLAVSSGEELVYSIGDDRILLYSRIHSRHFR